MTRSSFSTLVLFLIILVTVYINKATYILTISSRVSRCLSLLFNYVLCICDYYFFLLSFSLFSCVPNSFARLFLIFFLFFKTVWTLLINYHFTNHTLEFPFIFFYKVLLYKVFLFPTNHHIHNHTTHDRTLSLLLCVRAAPTLA